MSSLGLSMNTLPSFIPSPPGCPTGAKSTRVCSRCSRCVIVRFARYVAVSGFDVLTLRMFLFSNQAEVLGKRVVVQHIPLGGLLEWESNDNPAPSTASSVSQRSTPQSANQIYPSTAAPRASSRPAPARAMLPPMVPPAGLNSGATRVPWLNPHEGAKKPPM